MDVPNSNSLQKQICRFCRATFLKRKKINYKNYINNNRQFKSTESTMKKVKLVRESGIIDFEKEIDLLLLKGFKLYKNPFIGNDKYLYQLMVKK